MLTEQGLRIERAGLPLEGHGFQDKKRGEKACHREAKHLRRASFVLRHLEIKS